MTTSMGAMPPPLLPAYSLRVQLFAPNAYGEKDKPIRCFRVVTSPEVTVREFCEEASRIHEINYGHPIVIKKVQDDQQFDVTQAEILGSLFQTMSTIRVIQASGLRDSLPPTSALRYDSSVNKKREREGSVRPVGSNKRQRVTSHDPDQPLPSREAETNGHDGTMIPDSQETVILEAANGIFSNSRHVRTATRQISETPSPPPVLRNQFADHGSNLSGIQSLNGETNLSANTGHSSPLGEAVNRENSKTSHPSRARSASYHIPRPTERGASVSTAATSPLSVCQQLPPHNRDAPANKCKRPDQNLPRHPEFMNRSPNEDSIYENITSDDEGSAIIRSKKAILKQKTSPRPGLPGLEWIDKKLNTPPNGNRRSSANREPTATPGELPLTPKSKERQEKQEREIDQARKARNAAAEAAEQRRREADEARRAEETRVAGEERAKREEQGRIEVENSQRAEAERKAARLQKELEAREKKEVEDERCREEAWIAKKKAEQERLDTKWAAAAEATRRRDFEKMREKKAAELAEKERNAQEEAEKTRLPSSSPEERRPPKFSTSILPRSNSISRPQSVTPFIPSSRKSALKSSSQALRSSSPTGPPDTPSNAVTIEAQMPLPPKTNRRVSFQQDDTYTDTPILTTSRRILPPSKTSAPPAIIPKKVTNKPVAKPPIVQSKSTTPRSSAPILPPKRHNVERNVTPTTAAKVIHNSTASTSPQVVPPKKILPPVSSQPGKSVTPVLPRAPREKSKSSSVEPTSKKTPPRIMPAPQEEEGDSESDEEVPREAVSKLIADTAARQKQPSPLQKTAQEPESSDEEDDAEEQKTNDAETQSQNNSTRDSRSPVSFSQHPKAAGSIDAQQERSPESEKSTEDEEMEDAEDPILPTPVDTETSIRKSTGPESEPSSGDEDENEDEDEEMEDVEGFTATPNIAEASITQLESESSSEDDDEEKKEIVKKSPPGKKLPTQGVKTDSDPDSSSEYSESEEDEAEVEVPKSCSPVLPSHKFVKPVASKQNLVQNGKDSPSEEGSQNTQDEIDQQLTSDIFEAHNSTPPASTPIPASSGATKPPPIKFGASLSSLNQNRLALGSSSQAMPGAVTNRLSQPKLQLDEDEDEDDEESESEEDSESNDDSTSESEDDEAPADKRCLQPASSVPSKVAKADQSDAAVSDSDGSNSDADEKDEGQKIRDELAAQIAGLGASSQQCITLPSPKMYMTSTQQKKALVKTKEKKSSDKFLTGYKFSVA